MAWRWESAVAKRYRVTLTVEEGTVAKLGVRRPPPLAGVGRWPAGISARSRGRACRCRGRSGPGTADRPRAGTSASAATWPCGGSPGNWPCPRSGTSRPAGRPGALSRQRSASAGSHRGMTPNLATVPILRYYLPEIAKIFRTKPMPRNRVQHQKGLSDDAFERLYPDEGACRKAWFAWRWPEGFKCPRCAGSKYCEIRGRQLLQC